MNFFPILVFLLKEIGAACFGGACQKFSCISDFYVHRPLDNFLRLTSTFSSPCSCAIDWNSIFCNETMTSLKSNVLPLPTVCICRKFSDSGAKCQQFMTRCYQRKNNECSCCFNQPMEWCNQLKCRNKEPMFSNANTSCVCHHNPSDYPYEICENMLPRDNTFKERHTVLEISKEQKETNPTKEHIKLLGIRVPISMITYIIFGLLTTVSVLTLLMLFIGGSKLRKKRRERQRQTRLARETLIMQRADDDRYLPSA